MIAPSPRDKRVSLEGSWQKIGAQERELKRDYREPGGPPSLDIYCTEKGPVNFLSYDGTPGEVFYARARCSSANQAICTKFQTYGQYNLAKVSL